MAHPFYIANDAGLKFVPADASGDSVFLLREPTVGLITKLTSIPVNRLVPLGADKIVVTDSSGFLSTTGATNISIVELNQLDGVTSNIQTQLDSKLGLLSLTGDRAVITNSGGTNIIVSVTTAAELAYVSGVTSPIQAQIDAKQDIITGGATTITSNNLTPNRALISDVNGKVAVSPTTSIELSYLSGVVAPVQTQLNTKLTANVSGPAIGHLLYYTGSTWSNFPTGTTGQILSYNGSTLEWISPSVNGIPAGGTTLQYLVKNSNTNYDAVWRTLILDDVTDVAATFSEVNILAGALITTTELNYLDGVTSNIQTQFNTKLNNSLAYNSLWVGSSANTAVQLGPGAEDEVLTIVNGAPVWQPVIPPGDVSSSGSSTDNAIVRWNGTAGDSIQNSGVIIDDTNNISGVTSLTSGQIDILNQSPIRLHETGSTNYVGIRSSGTMSGDYTITLPSAAPGANTSLTFDGADYVWGPAGGVTNFLALTDTDPTTYVGQALKMVRVNAGETGLEFFTLAAGGTVTSVSGTTNRITITGTPTIAPVVDIAATYVGQTSITTLGTVATGTWNATNISLAKGGTGASLVDPNADRIFFWDDSAGSTAFLAPGTSLEITTTTIDVAPNAITDARLRDSAGLSVIGRTGSSTGDPADIIASTDGQVLRRNGSTLSFGQVQASSINMSTARILGRTTAGTGPVGEMIVENGLTLATGTLKLGGLLTGNTSITASGQNFGGSGFGDYHWSAADIVWATDVGAGVSIKNDTNHFLQLGQAAGVIFNVEPGSDAAGDMYYRSLSGQFFRLPAGESGMNLVMSGSNLPIWSNLVPQAVVTSSYTFTAADNGKLLYFSNAGLITATIPIGLPVGWQVLVWRGVGAGEITFVSDGTLEGDGFSLPTEKTAASIIHRGSNVHYLAGALNSGAGGAGSVTSVALDPIVNFMDVSGSPITTSGAFVPSLVTQNANLGFYGPASGSAATPTFRLQRVADKAYEEFDDVTGTTYTFVEADKHRIKRATNASGCTFTIPLGLTTGWASRVYRGAGAGVVSFASNGTLESAGTTLGTEKTEATVIHRGGNVHILLGDVISGVGTVTSVGLSVPSFLSVSGSPVTSSGTLAVTLSGTALPVTSGGTGLTALGAANRILAVNNAGTALEYKALSTSTTAVSNDVGVTLTGAAAIVINIPDASATVRGVITPNAQTLGGVKTFAVAPQITGFTTGSVLFTGASGVIAQDNANFFWDDTNNRLAIGTATPSTNTGVTTLGNVNASYFGTQSRNLSAGTVATNGFRIQNDTVNYGDFRVFSSGHSTNPNVAVLNSTLANGLVITTESTQPINIRNTFGGTAKDLAAFTNTGVGIYGVTAPTARLHLPAHTTAAGSAPLKFTTGTAMTTPEDGSLEYHSSHLWFTIGSTRFQLDQQAGGGGGTPGGSNTEVQVNNSGAFGGGGVFVPSSGNLTMGSASLSGDRTISAVNNTSNSTLVLQSQSSNFTLKGSNFIKLQSDSTGDTLALEFGAVGVSNTAVYGFRSGNGTNGESFNASSGGQLLMAYTANLNNQTGTASFVQHASVITLGSRTATGEVFYATYGINGLGDNIRLHKDGIFDLGVRLNEPSTMTNGIRLYADIVPSGSASLAVRTEQSVEAIGTFTASHKLKIKINGTWYWIQLDAV